jgi:hypothetical protein
LKEFPGMEPAHREFILRQHVFFVASAAATGHINLSPKGLDSLRLIGTNKAVYLDLTGSGNETAAHLLADGRLTLMFCAFEGAPLILRLYGHGHSLQRGDADYSKLLADEFGGAEPPGARQMIVLDVDRVQTSCGYAVPFLAFTGDRPGLTQWAEKKGEAGLEAYRLSHNVTSLDGFPTGLRVAATPAHNDP